MNGNNEFYQNSMINARKDNDEWKNAAGTCSPNLIEKSINENGDYSAKADGADGYSKVTVDVAGGGGETFIVEPIYPEDYDPSDPLEVNKTLTESIEAFNSNKRVELDVYPGEGFYAVAIAWDNNDDGSLSNLAFVLRSGTNGITVLTYVDETHVEVAFYSENE